MGRDDPRSAGNVLSVASARGDFGSGRLTMLALLRVSMPDAKSPWPSCGSGRGNWHGGLGALSTRGPKQHEA
jgi:hypothetical protein